MSVIEYFRAIGRSLRFWRKPPVLQDVQGLTQFCGEKSAFIAQTNLYGYLRTRAGLQHFNLFTNDEFTALLRPARSRFVLICLEDLTLYAVAALVLKGATHQQAEALARTIFNQNSELLSDNALRSEEYEASRKAFAAKLALVDWQARLSPAAFDKSTNALIELAPIVDTLKNYDTEIVCNSMRFKWMGVRAELKERLNTQALLASLD